MPKSEIKFDDVIQNMDQYLPEIQLQVIKEAINNPHLISPESAGILSKYIAGKRNAYFDTVIEDLTFMIQKDDQ